MTEGTTIYDGRFRLGRLLGEGGMGKVHHATQLNLDREVALKVVQANPDQPEALARFQREARVAAALKHPNVVEIYDVGQDEATAFIAMEYLKGTTLRDAMRPGVPMSLEDAMTIAVQLSSALIAAHALSVVHRDLKPENIFLETQRAGPPRVVVVDFGLAFISGDAERGRVTQEGVVVGTPTYLSPEQAAATRIGPASDIYSFGALLYEMVTGLPPFVGSDLNVLTQHLYVAPMAPSHRVPSLRLPRELEELITGMLAKRPDDRPRIAEVSEVLGIIEGTLSGRRARGRDARFLKSRQARMLSVEQSSPAAPELSPEPAPALKKLTLKVIGSLDFELGLALASNGVGVADRDETPDAVLVLDLDPAAVSTVAASGMPVLACCAGDDMEMLSQLARAGAADILTFPITIDDIMRKLHRALDRSGRRS